MDADIKHKQYDERLIANKASSSDYLDYTPL